MRPKSGLGQWKSCFFACYPVIEPPPLAGFGSGCPTTQKQLGISPLRLSYSAWVNELILFALMPTWPGWTEVVVLFEGT